MSSFRVCTAVVLVMALATTAYSQTLDDFLFGAFCNRPGMDKLIATCYTPAAVPASVTAGAAAYSAAPRGTFRGTGTAGDAVFTVIAEDPSKVVVKCTIATDATGNSASSTIKLFGVKGTETTLASSVSVGTSTETTGTFTAGVVIIANQAASYECSWKTTA